MASCRISPSGAELKRDVSTVGKMDPFCRVYVGRNHKDTETHNDGSKFPNWTASFEFPLEGEDEIRFEVWDKNTVSSNDLIGFASYAVSELRST